MPFKTQYYFLEAFLDGDIYSASADQRRFSTIDNQMYRIAELSYDGILDGWEIEDAGSMEISISAGGGLIDGFFVNTYDPTSFSLSDNSEYFLYAVRKPNIIGMSGPRSDLATVVYTDAGPPSAPAALTAVPDVFSVGLTWTLGTEVDLDHYLIERSTDGVLYDTIETLTNSTSSFEDTGLDEDTLYYYRVSAYDESETYASSIVTAQTLLNTTLPPDVSLLSLYGSYTSVNVLWSKPEVLSDSKISGYKIRHVELYSDDTEKTDTITEATISSSFLFYRIDDLLLGKKYKITLIAIDHKGRESEGATKTIITQQSIAPLDPWNIAYTTEDAVDGVAVNLSWNLGEEPYADPYDSITDPYRYRVYVTVLPGEESKGMDVPVLYNEYKVSMYTTDFVDYKVIPEDSQVVFRLTSLDMDGNESAGSYISFRTPRYSPASSLTDVSGAFDSQNGRIIIRWTNQYDTDDISLYVKDETTDTVILNNSIGLSRIYYINNITLGDRYLITITPINNANIEGAPSVVRVDTTSPDDPTGETPLEYPLAPDKLASKAGDRMIALHWTASSSLFTAYYKIYRRLGPVSFTSTDWTLIDTVPQSVLEFKDYGLENDSTYSYYITSVDIYGRESYHLTGFNINLNFVEEIPRASGIITEPASVTATLIPATHSVSIEWASPASEEFHAFAVWRSQNNLHSWVQIATVEKTTMSYTDEDFPLIDDTTYYYAIEKLVNDAEIRLQTNDNAPENSIPIGAVSVSGGTTTTDNSTRQTAKNLEHAIETRCDIYIPRHRHLGDTSRLSSTLTDLEKINTVVADRIKLDENIIISNWSTLDGKIWSTDEEDIVGSSYILKVDGRFPTSFYRIDTTNKQIIFSDAMATIDPETGQIDGEAPVIELEIFNVAETDGILDIFRFGDIHAKQVAYGKINKEQIPNLDHEGRIKEELLPKTFLLERFNDHTFVVPEWNTDAKKNFGEAVTFFSVIESDGAIQSISDFDSHLDGSEVVFRKPDYDDYTYDNINSGSESEVVSSEAYQSNKSYRIYFEFVDSGSTRWVKVSTADTSNSPNPVINLKKRIRFRVLLQEGSIYLALGVREISSTDLEVGSNGGTSGPIEWAGVNQSDTLIDELGRTVPVGVLISASNEWQLLDFDLKLSPVTSFSEGNGLLSKGLGVLEHLAFTQNSDYAGPVEIFIDNLEQIDDVLVAGTSQGIMISEDFGSTWELSRYTSTPVHKFYRSAHNQFLWAITADQVLLASDAAHWFTTTGTDGIQFIRDIAEDFQGNMFISTDRGVYSLDITTIYTLSAWVQTSPINAFSSQCYGMFTLDVDEYGALVGDVVYGKFSYGLVLAESAVIALTLIYVSTELGVYYTDDSGATWTFTGQTTEYFPVYKFITIIEDQNVVIAATKKHILRKLDINGDFEVVYNFEDELGLMQIWTIERFNYKLYVSTENGVYVSNYDIYNTATNIEFTKIVPELTVRSQTYPAFSLTMVQSDEYDRQLFIGSENKLLIMNESGEVSYKTRYNKDIPSFYLNQDEIVTGYIYNAFNNTISFRDAIGIQDTISSTYLPRTTFYAKNGGWIEQNPYSETFIYLNGQPVWIDFGLDVTKMNQELTTTESAITTAKPLLSDFNSYYPLSSTMADLVLSDILVIRADFTSVTTNEKRKNDIAKFYQDYSRFISMTTTTFASENNLVIPDFILIGISASQRDPDSKAAIYTSLGLVETQDINLSDLESSDDLNAIINSSSNTNEVLLGSVSHPVGVTVSSVGIQINSSTGEVIFPITFNKFDKLQITAFNTTLFNTGIFRHADLEDRLEQKNTGLTSDLATVVYGNLIKLGINLENRHPNMFANYNVSNIQSAFYAADSADWYDINNSTIDFQIITQTETQVQPNFVNTAIYFNGDEYGGYAPKVWFATDIGILEYEISDTNNLVLIRTIQPDSSNTSNFIQDIFVANASEIYAITASDATSASKIFATYDIADTWSEIRTTNLPERIFRFSVIRNNKVVSTENGVFYCNNAFGYWEQSQAIPSSAMPETSPSIAQFSSKVLTLEKENMLFAESDRWVYRSGSGMEWLSIGRFSNNDAKTINKLYRFKNITWIGTDKGLYADANTIMSEDISFGLQTTLEEEGAEASMGVTINDITSGNDALFCCSDQSKLYRYLDEGDGNKWKSYTVPDFGPIQKILYVESDPSSLIIAVSYNNIKVINVTINYGVF